MNCYYCDRIALHDASYERTPAMFDLGSAAPRCGRHWRYLCGQCNRPAHFMAAAYDPVAGRFYCSACATASEEVREPFWAWGYYFRYRSPFTNNWHPSLDRLEFEGCHPLQRYQGPDLHPSVSREPWLARYPHRPMQWPIDHVPDDAELAASWDRNADRWLARYDADGDFTRRYCSDPLLLELLGDVKGLSVLDAGCGGGYLCRKLARQGARMTGIELSPRLLERAKAEEAAERLGIAYHAGSIASMGQFADATFDRAVANFVLMDVRDYQQAIGEVHRVLKPGGAFVVVISHPCFACGPGEWHKPAPDSPRIEERGPRLVDRYLHRTAYAGVWGGLDPVISFHRPLRDYWAAFTQAGFAITRFEESAPKEDAALSPERLADCLRVSDACLFRLEKAR